MIVTRPHQNAAWIESLQNVLEKATEGAVSVKPTGKLVLSSNPDDLLRQVDFTISALVQVGRQLGSDNAVLMADNIMLTQANADLHTAINNIASAFSNVPFDDALDHATTGLIMAIESSGAGELTANGDLVFDSRITMSRGDIKPILKEAISTWLELKASKL
jgi:hypothetical protein